jgi:hypothetical protein
MAKFAYHSAAHDRISVLTGALLLSLTVLLGPQSARAVDYAGTVTFSGDVTFPVAIPGISAPDLVVRVGSSTEATGNGEKCSISATTSDNPDLAGTYPDGGVVGATMLLERGGPNIPEGTCVVHVTATGTDGVSVSARGSQTVFVPAAAINTSGNVAVDDIVVRESKAVAGIISDCEKWVKKQLKARDKCNARLLKKGPDAAEKCKDAGPEPVGCDPGQHVEAILALAHAANDQQTDAPNAEAVDTDVLKEQVKCQKRFGKAAVRFVTKYVKLINKKCVGANADTQSCRDTQSQESKKKLDQIDKCVGDQLVDGETGRTVPVVGAPCSACIVGGVLDRKCMKSCFELAVRELGDGIVGDIPVCGNGILQHLHRRSGIPRRPDGRPDVHGPAGQRLRRGVRRGGH